MYLLNRSLPGAELQRPIQQPDQRIVHDPRWVQVTPRLRGQVSYRVASGQEIELEPRSFDLALFSWSL